MSETIRRYESNPVLTANDVPYPATLIFNAGVAKWQGKYVMVFRNDYGTGGGDRPELEDTNLGVAWSDDGKTWTAEDKPCLQIREGEIRRVYDPRITVIDGRAYLCMAVDTAHGIRGGVAVTDDFKNFEILSLSLPDNRNMVLFPEKINGKYCRLERPMPIYGRHAPEAFDLWFSDTPDLKYWGNHQLVLGSEQVPFSNCKIGPGAPPVRTEKGWLAAIHSVYRGETPLGGWEDFDWLKRYDMGLMLLDLDEPWRVIGLSRKPLLVPAEPYETDGFRGSVLFPGGMILEDDGEVKIYYGAADTVEALATTHVDDLLALCEPLEG